MDDKVCLPHNSIDRTAQLTSVQQYLTILEHLSLSFFMLVVLYEVFGLLLAICVHNIGYCH